MAKISRSEPWDGSSLPPKSAADAKGTADERQRPAPLTPLEEEIVDLLAEALVNDYLETRRNAAARLKPEHRKGGSHGQDIDVNGPKANPNGSSVSITKLKESEPVERRLLSVREVAEYTGLSVHTHYTMTSQRRIPYVKAGRLTKFDLKAIDSWIERNSVKPLAK